MNACVHKDLVGRIKILAHPLECCQILRLNRLILCLVFTVAAGERKSPIDHNCKSQKRAHESVSNVSILPYLEKQHEESEGNDAVVEDVSGKDLGGGHDPKMAYETKHPAGHDQEIIGHENDRKEPVLPLPHAKEQQ